MDSSGSSYDAQTYYPYTFNANQWYNLTETVGNGFENVYVNGALVGQAALSGTPLFIRPDASYFAVGGPSNGGYWFDGTMDDLAVYNSVLTPDQILATYNSVLNSLPVPPSFPTTSPVQIGAGVLDLAGV